MAGDITGSSAPAPAAPVADAAPGGSAGGRSYLVKKLSAEVQKLQPAIKALRQHTGLGLKESKELIEAWPRTHAS